MLKKEEKNNIDTLLKLGKKIHKWYKEIIECGGNEFVFTRLKGLIKVESALISSLGIDEAKIDDIAMYLIDKGGINIDNKMLTVMEPHFDDTTYPFYRLFAKCKYYFYSHKSLDLSVGSMRIPIIDNEVASMYSFLMGDYNKEENGSRKRELLKYIIFTLVDSSDLEEKVLDSYLQSLDEKIDALPMYCDLAIMKTIKRDAKILDCRIDLSNNVCSDLYHIVLSQRDHEVLDDLFKLFIQYVSLTGPSYYGSATFKLYIDYFKTIIANSPKELRNILYDDVTNIINSLRDGVKDKYTSIFRESKREIEEESITRVKHLSLANNKHKF